MSIDLKQRATQALRQTYTQVAKQLPAHKSASRYEEAIFGAQSTSNFHYRSSWDPHHELFDASRSAIQLDDWQILRDPRQFYYANWSMTRARQQATLDANYQFVEANQLLDQLSANRRAQCLSLLTPLRHLAWGGNMNNCSIAAYGYGSVFTAPAMLHALDHLGVAQYLTRLSLSLGNSESLETGRQDWLHAPHWQDLRHYIEDTFVLQDPFELFVAQNLALDGLLYPLIYDHVVKQHLGAADGIAITMLTTFMPEWHHESAAWINAVIKTAAQASAANQQLLQQWTQQWQERAQTACIPLAELALGEQAAATLNAVQQHLLQRCQQAGIAA